MYKQIQRYTSNLSRLQMDSYWIDVYMYRWIDRYMDRQTYGQLLLFVDIQNMYKCMDGKNIDSLMESQIILKVNKWIGLKICIIIYNMNGWSKQKFMIESVA